MAGKELNAVKLDHFCSGEDNRMTLHTHRKIDPREWTSKRSRPHGQHEQTWRQGYPKPPGESSESFRWKENFARFRLEQSKTRARFEPELFGGRGRGGLPDLKLGFHQDRIKRC